MTTETMTNIHRQYAKCVVERPSAGGQFRPLDNYILNWWSGAEADASRAKAKSNRSMAALLRYHHNPKYCSFTMKIVELSSNISSKEKLDKIYKPFIICSSPAVFFPPRRPFCVADLDQEKVYLSRFPTTPFGQDENKRA
jgi:hypothetical protein